MEQHRTVLIFILFTLFFSTHAIVAQTITEKYKNITVNAEWVASSTNTSKKPVFLLLHGSLAHGKMELIQATQTLLKEKGYQSLAITLSLNEANRKGMYDCKSKHTHKITDAGDELGFWLAWLKKKGVSNVYLLGHSIAPYQLLSFVNSKKVNIVKKLILYAPTNFVFKQRALAYKKQTGKSLESLLSKAASLKKQNKGKTLMGPVRFLHCNDAKVSAESFFSYYKNSDQLTISYQLKLNRKKNNLPVQVFVGSDDKLAGHFLPELKQLAKKNLLTLQVINGANHFFRDLYLEDVVDAIVEKIK